MVLRLKNSRIEFGLILFTFAAALLSLFFVDLPLVVLFGLAVAIVYLLTGFLREYFFNYRRIQQISHSSDGWQLVVGDQKIEVAAPKVKYFSEFLISAVFSTAQRRTYHVLIFPDSLETLENLRFRKHLRFDMPAPSRRMDQ